jgi:RHS repeat-associated protein
MTFYLKVNCFRASSQGIKSSGFEVLIRSLTMALCSSGISSTLVNQLTNANMSRRSYTTWQNNLTSWNTAYTFDLNGNIQSLFREGAPDIDGYPTNLDNLSYTYQGNKITAIADSYGNLGFADLASTTEEYQYDANGNMIEDKNKGISQIRYNRMNLPEVITFSNGNEIHYLYDAGGSKLQKIAIPAAGGQTTTDYSGGFVYTNNSIDFFAFSEGRVRKVGANWQYQYDLKDHLGNVRATFTNDNGVATLLQADSYYPFGYKMPGLSYQTGAENKFTYNGKELEDEFGLDWYHYGARYYDPVIGRWWAVDPLDEFYSPFAYVGNNPIMLIDPNGMNSDCPDRGCPPPSFWNIIGEKIVKPINDLFSGAKEWLFAKNEFVAEQTSYVATSYEKNILKTVGSNIAALSDFTSNSTLEPYVSLSISKSDAFGYLPIFFSVTKTPNYTLITSGADITYSSPILISPASVSFGVFAKYGKSPILLSDLIGPSSGISGGYFGGLEYSNSNLPFLLYPNTKPLFNPYTNTHQVGINISGSAWSGYTGGYTIGARNYLF